jgi:hypothetical protein
MRNFWFEHVIDAYLAACAEGRDWREACVAADRALGARPRRLLTFKDLKEKKGVPYSRQHLDRKMRAGTFPLPFNVAPGYHKSAKKSDQVSLGSSTAGEPA